MNGLRQARLLALTLLVSGSASAVAQEALPQDEAPQAQEAAQPQAMSAQLAAPAPKSEQAPVQVAEAQPAPQQQQVQLLVPPQQGPRILRNLVVPQFSAPPKSRARAAVLQTLADHSEVEVVSIDDVTFASHRLQADPNTPDGRAKLSRELGIDGWLDGEVTETSAHLTLTAGDGTMLQEVDVETENEKHLDALTGERMWYALGPSLSAHEAYRRALLAEYERARRKYEARLNESQRQVGIAHAARARRAFVLRGQFALAQRKQAAQAFERGRQSELGRIELAREAEVARLAEQARLAEVARKAELAREAEKARQAEIVARREKAKQAKLEAAAKRAQAKNDRDVAKRKKSKRGLNGAGLTNTGGQRAHAKALAKKKAKAQARGAKARSSAAVSGKDKNGASQPQLLSRQ